MALHESSLSCVYDLRVVNPAPERIELPDCMYPMRPLICLRKNCTPAQPTASDALLQANPEASALNRRLDNILNGASQLLMDVTGNQTTAVTPNHPLTACQTQSQVTDPDHQHRLQRIHWLISSLELLQAQVSSPEQPLETNPRVVDQQDVFVDRIDWITKAFRSLVSNIEAPSLSKKSVEQEIVIKVNPQRPPYFLLACRQILPKGSISLRSFVHSTASAQVSPALLELFNQRQENCVLNLCVIWSLSVTQEPEMLVSPVQQSTPIVGEENIVRYVMRSVGRYDQSDAKSSTALDYWLDLVPLLTHDPSAVLKKAEAQLKKHKFLTGNSVSVVDSAIWSASQAQLPRHKGAGSLAAWSKSCWEQAKCQLPSSS